MVKKLPVALALVLAISPAIVQAKCGGRLPPDYNDIEVVVLQQNGCGATLHPRAVTKFDCSWYYAMFRNAGPLVVDRTYSQHNLVGEIGTYTLSTTLEQVRDVMRKHDFFTLSPKDQELTDIAESTLTITRCAVTTEVRIMNEDGYVDAETLSLFIDLRSVIEHSTKTRVSSGPTDNIYDLPSGP